MEPLISPAALRRPVPEIYADDAPSVLVTLLRLGDVLDRALSDPDRLSATLRQPSVQSAMRIVLGHTSTARRVQLLEWLSQADLPDRHRIMAGLLGNSTDDLAGEDAGRITRESIVHLRRSELLALIFAPERVNLLLSVCGGEVGPCD
jgi:hypothetical protein